MLSNACSSKSTSNCEQFCIPISSNGIDNEVEDEFELIEKNYYNSINTTFINVTIANATTTTATVTVAPVINSPILNSNYVCACAFGYELNDDKKTCISM